MDFTTILLSQIVLLTTGNYVWGFSRNKPGSCPGMTDRLPSMSHFACSLGVKMCNTDEDCNGLEKCCSDVCGSRCKAARMIDPFVTPGTCPPQIPGLVTTCQITADSCRRDRDCIWGNKCCPSGCGKTCQEAVAPSQANTRGLPRLNWPGQ